MLRVLSLTLTDDTILVAENSNDPKQLLIRIKQENAKPGLHLDIKKPKIMTREKLQEFTVDSEEVNIVIISFTILRFF